MKYFLIIIILATAQIVFAQDSTQFKMSDFIGVNTNVASYDQHFIDDLAKCSKWIREYHSWGHFEVADNYYRWDNITKTPYNYTWPDHNKFMDECKRLGVNVLIDVLNKPDWAGSARGAYSTGDGSKATDYLDKLEFMGQLVARYGAQKIDKSLLETADKISGQNYIKYYEDDNEPNYWWETPIWPAEKYAVYCNAVHDGFGVETSDDYPLLGVKSVDSTAMHVLGGLAEKGHVAYIQKILDESDGRIPFDVINIHTYCKDTKDGYSPENESYGIEKNLAGFMSWCKRTLPDIPIWITEFGWDTYMKNNQHSYIYAPQPQQANYILRSYFVSLKMGFEKAFLFMGKDPNSLSTEQFSSSGLLMDKNAGLAKKISYYYLATMQNILGDAVLSEIVSYRKLVGSNDVYSFKFINDESEIIYALWTRKKNSKTDIGATQKYSVDIGYEPEYAYSILPKDKSYDGERTDYTIDDSSIEITLTETPQFLVVAENKTSAIRNETFATTFSVFPNPSDGEINISIYNPKSQEINISIYSIDGRLINVISNSVLEKGQQNFVFNNELLPGIYLVSLNTKGAREIKKIIIQ